MLGARRAWSALACLLGLALAGCGAAGVARTTTDGIPRWLAAEARPIGRSPRFHPPPGRSLTGRCTPRLGMRDAVHVELFAANRVVLVPAGISVGHPLAQAAGRIVRARCYGALVTLDPTGVVLVRRGLRPSLGDLFRAWGQRLSQRHLASFAAPPGGHVTVYVDGRRWPGPPASVPLERHHEIVLEVGPHVPPHASYTFPPGF
ncbi:MAG: hypothetical protein ACRDLV_11725 [Solirubrobacteraceae bacterium]